MDAEGRLHGAVDDQNRPDKSAPRGSVQHARALWFFSALAGFRDDPKAAEAAHATRRGFAPFFDRDHGGVFWALDADGTPSETRKQTYAQAFAIYALSAYAAAFEDEAAKEEALTLARLLEERTVDRAKGGYLEAFAQDWSAIPDQRLSAKDMNAPKTMNTHLHVLEGYTALHALCRSEFTAGVLADSIDLFADRFSGARDDGHLALFYDDDWNDQGGGESYGHGIEASWLLHEAAVALGDQARLSRAETLAIRTADAALTAYTQGGGLAYERHEDGTSVGERHWWVQAEAMVGFENAYALSGEAKYRDTAAGLWDFIRAEVIDPEHGEWGWFSRADLPARGPYKSGFWKGPYHNGRAMMEMIRRLKETT
nr:AGE family epimerase/isomerase [Parvularcula dongshanensis]